MKFYRWVIIPLISAMLLSVSLGISFIIIGFPLIKFGFLLGFITGGLIGFGLQIFNEYKTKIFLPNATEIDFDVVQNKVFTLFTSYDETVSICMKFLKQNLSAKIRHHDFSTGVIEAKTRMGWKTNGNIVKFELRKITEDTTEIEFSTKPAFGEGIKIVEKLNDFLLTEGEKREFNTLGESREISIDRIFDTTSKMPVPILDSKDSKIE
jgi:hypothetical protein